MKNYSSYKKTKEVYFNSEILFPIISILIISLITYALTYTIGLIIAFSFNVFISFCFYYYLYYYGKSNKNITFGFLIGVTLITTLLLFINYGVYTLVVYQKTGVFNKIYFQVWLALIIGIPVSYLSFEYGYYYFREIKMATTYLKVRLNIYHDKELLNQIDHIIFVNTNKAKASDIKLDKAPCYYSEDELTNMENNKTRNFYLEKDIFNETIHLPFGTNYLSMAWYSIIEDKYYSIKLPLSFDKLIIEQEKYPTNVSKLLRGKKTKQLNLHLYPNGKVQLFNSDCMLIDHSCSAPIIITEEERSKKIKKHRLSHQFYNNSQNFSKLITSIRSSDQIEERFIIQNKFIPWSMTISGLGDNYYLEIDDVSFKSYNSEVETLNAPFLRFLPKKITFTYRGSFLISWLTLRINTQKLYKQIQILTAKSNNTNITFELAFKKTTSTTKLAFTIKANGKSIAFTDWEIEIDKDRELRMTKHLITKKGHQAIQSLLKEAWDLVASKKYTLAQEKCDALFVLDPEYGFAYFLEARLLWYTKGFEACIENMDYFFSRTKHDTSALAHIYNHYGCILDLEFRYTESKYYFEKAIETTTKEGMYLCNLSEIYCKLNDPKKAMQFALKAKKIGYISKTLDLIIKSKGVPDFTKQLEKTSKFEPF
ncbi:hypothetical protein HNQ02_002123 [Flavobacterium sp. 7E]|uniref:tetratricopeptide repeat protein n=1 Tax=Flavobacterium sp. 7E TaxID=2735898 RepID=UPI001C2DC56C|nr:DUF2931 family protein [Flavobacterium sp. 7E]NRS89201.1 hypothetical protein [Flavobacterium sp. 7E]